MIRNLTFFLLTASFLTGCGDPSPSEPGNTYRGQVVVPEEGRVYAGWYTHDVLGEIDDYVVVTGAVPAIVFTFHDWNSAGPAVDTPILQTFEDPSEGSTGRSLLDTISALAARGATPAVAWSSIGYPTEDPAYFTGDPHVPISFDEILAGTYDAYIRACARQIRALGSPVMLSPFAEINSTAWFTFGADERTPLESVDDTRSHYGDPDVPDGPERVCDVFRYVVDRFDEENVENVTWFMYTSTAFMNPAALDSNEVARMDEMHPRYFYPGDEYVDWVGTSVYIETSGTENLSFALSHAMAAYREVTQRAFFVPEFGVLAGQGISRVQVLSSLLSSEIPASGIDAFCFADSDLYAQVFGIPRLAERPDEAAIWRTIPENDGTYSLSVRTEEREDKRD